MIDDLYNQLISTPLRHRGPPPKLTDSEVITMEIVGEWQGHHLDKTLWKYFSQHWKPLFPNIPDRSQFVRQAANLWVVKQRLQDQLVKLLNADRSEIHLIDGFPIEVCARTRASRCKIFRGEAGFGYCASKKKRFYGFQGNLLIDGRGIPVSMEVTAANIDERDVAYELIDPISVLLIGDKGYIRPALKADCKGQDIDMQTPLRRNMRDKRSPAFVRLLMRARRRIETVIGQLVQFFDIETVRCRDLWHLTSRIARKLLGYTVAIYLNIQAGHPAMQFEKMISA